MTGNDWIRNAGEAPVPEVDIRAAHFRSNRAEQGGARGQIRTRELANLDRLSRRRHHGSQCAVAQFVRYPLRVLLRTGQLITTTLSLLLLVSPRAAAQTYEAPQPRRQFVAVSYDWLYTQPLHFADHPLSDLVGSPVAAAQLQPHDYETRDGATRIDVEEFRRRGNGFGVTVYPFGLRSGATLGLRGSVERLPTIALTIDGPGALDTYELRDAKAFDASAGLFVADRAPGWGLGSHAFVAGGVGTIRSGLGDGSRYFAEAGGGISSGPLGVELSVKFAWNRLTEPVEHRFLTVPVAIRGTVGF